MQTRAVKEEVTVQLRGNPLEFRKLFDELSTWTPGGGWSKEAKQFFDELEKASTNLTIED